MRSKNILILLFGLFASVCFAQNETDSLEYNTNTFRQMEILSPWLMSNNAAGMGQMVNLYPVMTDLGFGYQSGDFKNVFQGQSQETYRLGSKSYQKTGNTVLFGEFAYRKSYERNLDFNNLNNPEMNQPYLLADTIGNDTYDREFFKLGGGISSPINTNLDWGMKFKYEVGLAAQNRDPRPENKVLQLSVSPGIIWKLPEVKLGLVLNYSYYNEDIDIKVVKENTDYTLFQLHGLGTSTYHVAKSFYRLYQQNQFGAGTQLSWNTGKLKNFTTGNISYLDQQINDGRQAGNASWSAVKNDAQLIGMNYELIHISTLKKNQSVNQLQIKLNKTDRLGTEFIQRLEKVGATDLQQWITYGEEQKYYSKRFNLQAKASRMVLSSSGQIASLLSFGASSAAFTENYYIPNLKQNYQNILLNASWLKSFFSGSKTFSVELRMAWQTNLSANQNMMNNSVITQKIIQPDFDYFSAGYWAPGTSVTYEMPLKNRNKYFIKTDFDWFMSDENQSRTFLNFSTGIIF